MCMAGVDRLDKDLTVGQMQGALHCAGDTVMKSSIF